MRGLDFNKIKRKFCVGDKVIISSKVNVIGVEKQGVVVGIYNRFFNVEYPEGYQESISYAEVKGVYIIDKGYN